MRLLHQPPSCFCQAVEGFLVETTGSTQSGQFSQAVPCQNVRADFQGGEGVKERHACRRDGRLCNLGLCECFLVFTLFCTILGKPGVDVGSERVGKSVGKTPICLLQAVSHLVEVRREVPVHVEILGTLPGQKKHNLALGQERGLREMDSIVSRAVL